MTKRTQLPCYRYGEARTADGQLVEFTSSPDDQAAVSEFLRTRIGKIEIPATGRVNIEHGGYGQYTRYDIIQHDYAGGGPGEAGGWGYIEVLEIKNPPNGRWGIVVNECQSDIGSVFSEWETVKDARAAFSKYWDGLMAEEKIVKLAGFKRRVACGALTPWFYAIGDEELIGDYAFPEGLQEDSVYRFGRKFVVFDSEKTPAIKICMGTRFITRKKYLDPYAEESFRLVYWDDGSVWDESQGQHDFPRPAEEGEIWIAEAVERFRRMLAGNSDAFVIRFTDGSKFVGRLVQGKKQTSCAEGDYFLTAQIRGEKKPREGWVNNFKPTPEAANVIQYVVNHFAQNSQVVECVKIKKIKAKKGGKKWLGAFFHSAH